MTTTELYEKLPANARESWLKALNLFVELDKERERLERASSRYDASDWNVKNNDANNANNAN